MLFVHKAVIDHGLPGQTYSQGALIHKSTPFPTTDNNGDYQKRNADASNRGLMFVLPADELESEAKEKAGGQPSSDSDNNTEIPRHVRSMIVDQRLLKPMQTFRAEIFVISRSKAEFFE